MKLLVIRHGLAAEREPSLPDEDRALTVEGRRRVKRAARGLARLVPRLDCLATSPLRRAHQTAELVARRYDGLEPRLVAELSPQVPLERLMEWLSARDPGETLALVGHEDRLSRLVGWLMSGQPESRLVLKKSGACLLRIAGPCQPGGALLEWLLTPSQLTEIG
jgi:phosphohistidine phosphatase